MQAGLRRTTIYFCVCILSSLLFNLYAIIYILIIIYLHIIVSCIHLFKFVKRDHHPIHPPFRVITIGWISLKFLTILIRENLLQTMCSLTGGVVSWVSKLQTVVALSTTKVEYIATTQACKEAIWIKRLLKELRHKQEKISLFCNSQSALHIARNPIFHSKTKHIGVQYHFVQEVVEEGIVNMQKIDTKVNLADALTKPINIDKFN